MMKSFVIFAALCVVFIRCDEDEKRPELIGQWKQTASYFDTGGGIVTHAYTGEENIISFFADSTYTCSLNMCAGAPTGLPSGGTFTRVQIIPSDCPGESHRYYIEGDYLTITSRCIEACGETFRKID
jgi:hypothetical protein